MLTGRRPFEGDNDAAVARSITDTTPEPIARYKSGTTGELQQIVDKALTNDSTLRYQHADGMLADLKRLSLETKPTSRRRTGLWVSLTAAVIAIALTPIYMQSTRQKEAKTGISEYRSWPTIAVLYLETFSDEADQEFFAAGMTEDIITDLTKIHGLRVLSRHDVMPYKGKDVTIEQIGKDLEVDYIVEGSIRRSGDQLRVTAQLIKVADGFHAWADRYDRTLKEVFAVQAEIASSIAHALEVVLTTDEQSQLAYEPTDNIDAYGLYIQANQKFFERTTSSNLEAESFYRRAIALDEDYLLARIGLADCYIQRLDWNFDRDPRWWAEANQILEYVRSKDSSHAELFMALTNLHRVAGSDERASVEARRAIELRPNASRTHYLLAVTLRGEERKKEFLKAAELDPGAADPYRWLSRDALYSGEPEEALRYAERAIQLAPRAPHMLISIGRRYVYLGEFEAARDLFSRLRAIDPEQDRGDLAYLLCFEGRLEEAIPGLLESTKKYQDPDDYRRLFQAYLSVGDDGRAGEALQNAVRIWRGFLQGDAASLQSNIVKTPMWLLWADCVKGKPVDEDSLLAVCGRSLDSSWLRNEFYWQQANDLVRVYAACGKKEETLKLLEEILDSKVFSVRYFATDPDFYDMQNDPDFKALLRNFD
jgi:TolB-like protein/Flp pilus assembly protein TadD